MRCGWRRAGPAHQDLAAAGKVSGLHSWSCRKPLSGGGRVIRFVWYSSLLCCMHSGLEVPSPMKGGGGGGLDEGYWLQRH